jgi:tRNA threonylcarbamoyl adenosine modification protein YeaZ
MIILALEFSSEQRSVAVLRSNGDREAGVSPAPVIAATKSSPRTLNAFHLIETALKQAGLEREDIECLAVGVGPGSYTGIRAAISIAQGWQLVRELAVLSVSSVECIALQAQAAGLRGRINFVIDAQRNEFYLAAYEIGAAVLRETEPLRLTSYSDVAARAQAGETIAGPEVERWFPSGRVVWPDAGALARLAANRTDFVSGEKLEPIYLRATTFVKAPPRRVLPK